MDNERERERRTYQLCRLGFAILSISLVIACLTELLVLPRHFGVRPFVPGLRSSWFWIWIDAPVVWGCLVGAYLFWGRWTHPGWQRRAGLLVLLSLADIVLWFLNHGDDLGLRLDQVGHEWLRYNLGPALGWAEFALIASLACDVMVHLGVEQAAETGKATRSLAATGAIIWMMYFCQLTNWHAWPLMIRRPVPIAQTFLLDLGWTMIWTITLIQVTALAIAATRQCSNVIAEMDREDADRDPLKPVSERDFGLLSGPTFE